MGESTPRRYTRPGGWAGAGRGATRSAAITIPSRARRGTRTSLSRFGICVATRSELDRGSEKHIVPAKRTLPGQVADVVHVHAEPAEVVLDERPDPDPRRLRAAQRPSARGVVLRLLDTPARHAETPFSDRLRGRIVG